MTIRASEGAPTLRATHSLLSEAEKHLRDETRPKDMQQLIRSAATDDSNLKLYFETLRTKSKVSATYDRVTIALRALMELSGWQAQH